MNVRDWMLYYDRQEIQHLQADAAIERAMFGQVETSVERVKGLQRVADAFAKNARDYERR